MANGITIRSLASLAAQLGQRAQSLYQAPPNDIRGVDATEWPSPSQPVKPIAPAGANPLQFSFWMGQNLTYTPRPDAEYTAEQLKNLATYSLARMCISNSKDQLGQIPWEIRLRQLPGESKGDVKARRKVKQAGDDNIVKISRFFEYPDREHSWSEWTRIIAEAMLVTDSAAIFVGRTISGQLAELSPVLNSDEIARYVDETGRTPLPNSPAYAQLYNGIPRVNLTTDQLIYRPRNIVPRSTISSYLYGMSPTEEVAEDLQIGMMRQAFVKAFYTDGAMPNLFHVVPKGVDPDTIKTAMQWVNSEQAGNFKARRQYRIIQGYNDDGKPDQFIEVKEPVLADTYDELHIKKIAFAYGTSPQRLIKQMNRGSATVSQQAAVEEGIEPWNKWFAMLVNFIIQRMMQLPEYEISFDLEGDLDITKQSKADRSDVDGGIRTRDEVRYDRGLDPLATENPLANKLTVTTANGVVELGQVLVSGKGGPDANSGAPPVQSHQTAASPTKKYLNGHASVLGLVHRGSDEVVVP